MASVAAIRSGITFRAWQKAPDIAAEPPGATTFLWLNAIMIALLRSWTPRLRVRSTMAISACSAPQPAALNFLEGTAAQSGNFNDSNRL
jgi:hypothetical protein